MCLSRNGDMCYRMKKREKTARISLFCFSFLEEFPPGPEESSSDIISLGRLMSLLTLVSGCFLQNRLGASVKREYGLYFFPLFFFC